jgi:hypothetical protein
MREIEVSADSDAAKKPANAIRATMALIFTTFMHLPANS